MREVQLTITKVVDQAVAVSIAQVAAKCACEIIIYAGTRRANAKSLVGVIGMGFKKGESVIVRTDGADEESALEAITKILN